MAGHVDVQIAGSSYAIEEPRLRRGKLIAKAVSAILNEVPNLEMEIETWSRKWERDTAYKLDRAQAKQIFGSQLIYEPKIEDGEPALDEDGNPVMVPKQDEQGNYVYGPDRLVGIGDADWEGSGNVLTRSQPPSDAALTIHLFKVVYEKAEGPLMRLLALMLIKNSELKQAHRGGTVDKLIEEKQEFLDDEAEFPGDLVKLALATLKLLRGQYDREKDTLKELQGEVRALRTGGQEPEPTATGTSGTSEKLASSTSSSPEAEADTPGPTRTSSSESSRESSPALSG